MDCIEIAKNKFKKDYKIIAVTVKEDNFMFWQIVDPLLLDDMEDKQYALVINKFTKSAIDYNHDDIYIYDFELKRERIIKRDLIHTDMKYSILGVRGRYFSKPIWKIEEDNLKLKLKGKLISFRHCEEEFVANDYREGIFIMKNKLTKKIVILDCKSHKIVMKK